MPHGPDQAVSPMVTAFHGPPCSKGGGGSFCVSGCPARKWVRSGSRPVGPNLWGVWQSLHPMAATRYLPRSTEEGFERSEERPAPISRAAPAPIKAILITSLSLFIREVLSFCG